MKPPCPLSEPDADKLGKEMSSGVALQRVITEHFRRGKL